MHRDWTFFQGIKYLVIKSLHNFGQKINNWIGNVLISFGVRSKENLPGVKKVMKAEPN